MDAGCGTGAEAIWLASHGWQVTAVDISSEALARAAVRAEGSAVSDRVRWVEADLTTWAPKTRFDLVTTHYAHPRCRSWPSTTASRVGWHPAGPS
ncbi:class I SAM-dependent methyltransferase [Micromonospora sp. M12]